MSKGPKIKQKSHTVLARLLGFLNLTLFFCPKGFRSFPPMNSFRVPELGSGELHFSTSPYSSVRGGSVPAPPEPLSSALTGRSGELLDFSSSPYFVSEGGLGPTPSYLDAAGELDFSTLSSFCVRRRVPLLPFFSSRALLKK